MAKIGEGDPRWLVEERTDGANVNNWHWTELDCTAWIKERFTSLLTGISHEEDGKSFKITVDTVTGEASVNTRKGKVLYFYELDVKMKYEGAVNDNKLEGKIQIPYIGEENDDDEFEVKVTPDTSDEVLVKFIKEKGIPLLKEAVKKGLAQYREEKGPKNLKATPQVTTSFTNIVKSSPTTPAASSQPAASKPSPSSSSSDQKSLTQKIKFKGPLDEVFSCLLDPQRISMFTQSPSVISPQEGSKFSFYGGVITGEIKEVAKNSKIVQTWRMGDWPEGQFSTVTMKFESTSEGTTLNLTQTNIPADSYERVKGGWDEKFWRRMKMLFGWGSLN